MLQLFFILGLFNDILNTSGCILSYGKMLIQKWTVKGVEGNGSSLSEVISHHLPGRTEEHEKEQW
jgi:hypothetical protein